MRFLGNVLATIVGLFLFFFLFIFLSVALVSSFSTQSQEVVKVARNSVLKLTLNKPFKERITEENPFEDLDVLPAVSNVAIGLIDLKNEIENAKLDPNISGIYLEISILSAGFATLEELRNSLLDFKSSGKFIVAYGEFFTEGAYYLASVADEIYLNPVGILEFDGLSTEVVYLKEFLNNIGIEPEVFRVGEYKSAVEPFLRNDMSPENRFQIQTYLNGLLQHYLQEIAEERNIAVGDLATISENALIRTPADALTRNLITDTLYYDQVIEVLKERSGLSTEDQLSLISYSQYKKSERYNRQAYSANKVAVIVAEGQIISGDGADGFMGGNKIAQEIRKARKNEDIKAIVLRINSPGGSALASDIMWREVTLAAKVKPIIASFSDVAASGGYYMAMACDTIVTYPNSITGSIGIFALLFNAESLLTNKLGMHFETVSTGELSNLASPTKRFSEAERKLLQQNVEKGYKTFIGKAAEGRDLPLDSLRSLASGRVWTGAEAIEVGLADIEGGLDTAIEIAASAAGVESDYMVRYYPKKKDFLSELLDRPIEKVSYLLGNEENELLQPIVEKLKMINALEGAQALLPFEVIKIE
ncbi:MAG: signal peptide peptidase SppA [Bacteroidota bacterium]